MQTSTCTGCTISLVNLAGPSIKDMLLDQIARGVDILRFRARVTADAGEPVIEVSEDMAEEKKGEYVLVVQGAIPTTADAVYGAIGEREGKPVEMQERVKDLARNAMVVLAVGTCAAFGGAPADATSPTGYKPVRQILETNGITKPLINIPACPPNPHRFALTLANILLNGLPKAEDLDENLRPLAFYGHSIHKNCP